MKDQTIEEQEQNWRLSRAFIFGTLFLIFCTATYFYTKDQTGIPSGTLKIEAPPDVDIYINETYLGTGNVEVSWRELLSEPLLTPRTPTEKISATMVSGKGAVLVGDQEDTGESFRPYLCKRVNGQLDYVWVIDEPYGFSGKFMPFVVLIRLRSKQNFYAGTPSVGIGSRRLFKIGKVAVGESALLDLSFPSGNPPAEFKEEIDKNGLWTP